MIATTLVLDSRMLLQDGVSRQHQLTSLLSIESGLIDILISKHPFSDIKGFQSWERGAQATTHGHQPGERGLHVVKGRLCHTALALLFLDVVAVREEAPVLRFGEGPGPFQVKGREGRRGADPEPVGTAVVLVGDEVVAAHDHDVCRGGGIVDEISRSQYSILREQMSALYLMPRGMLGTCVGFVVNLPRRHSQGNVGRLSLGKSLIVPHHSAQETQAFWNGHEGYQYPVACRVERGDQRGKVFRVAARRLEEHIDFALDGPFAC